MLLGRFYKILTLGFRVLVVAATAAFPVTVRFVATRTFVFLRDCVGHLSLPTSFCSSLHARKKRLSLLIHTFPPFLTESGGRGRLGDDSAKFFDTKTLHFRHTLLPRSSVSLASHPHYTDVSVVVK